MRSRKTDKDKNHGEVKEFDIQDPIHYFSNFEIMNTDIEMSRTLFDQENMISCDGRSYPSRIYMFGDQEIEAIVFTKVVVLGRRENSSGKIYCKVNQEDQLIYQLSTTNSIEVMGINDRVLRTKLKGNLEPYIGSLRLT